MALARPSLRELIDRAESDINARLPGADSRLRRSILSVVARVVAYGFHSLYGFVVFVADQIFPDTATAEYLARQLSIWGVVVPDAAKATGSILCTGGGGSIVPAAVELQTGDGIRYVTTASGAISGGQVSIPVEAVVASESANQPIGVVLTFTEPQPGIDATATVEDDGNGDGLTGGTDPEGDEEQRARLLERIQDPPQGGAEVDYRVWAKLAPDVTRAFVYPLRNGPGTVGVTFTVDERANPVPLAADVAAVDAILQERRPVTADVATFAPTALPVAYDVTVTPDNAEVRAAIEDELRDLHARDAEPGQTLPLSRIGEAISSARGEFSHVLNAPASDVVPATDIELPTFGSLSWT